MKGVCKGAPKREEEDGKPKYGGMWGQLRKLMRRIHPKTGQNMEKHRNQDGTLWGPGLKLYSNLRPPADPQPMPEGFYEYVPEPKPELIKVEPGVTQAAVEARMKRILEKEAENRNKKMLMEEEQSGSGSGMVIEVVLGGTLEIHSGSTAYHIKGDTPRLQDDPWSQSVEGGKKRGGSLESKNPHCIHSPTSL